MDAKLDGTVHDEVHGHSMQVLDGEPKLVGNAVDDVAQQMIAVDGLHMDGDRVEDVFLFLELYGYDAVAKLRMASVQLRLWILILPSASLNPMTSSPGIGLQCSQRW